ncbi:hypothetical protein [Larkinella harenae]
MKRKIYKHMNLKKVWPILVLTIWLDTNLAHAQAPVSLAEKDTPAMQLSFREIGKLKFRLEITQPLLQLHDNVAVFIMSDNRQILYANNYSHHELRVTTFDLSTLQDGTYSFEVRSGGQRFAQLFDIKTKMKRIILDRN